MATILIVEDDFIQASALEEAVLSLGHEVIGPAADIRHAMAALDACSPDAALVDLDLGGEDATSLVTALASRGVPLAIVTGYGNSVDRQFPEHLVIHKPLLSETAVGDAMLQPSAACGAHEEKDR